MPGVVGRTTRRSTISRSASFITQQATGVPLRPSTPQASGWSSGIWPLALKVVMTGAPSRSASAITAAMSKRAPWPTMITGRDDPAISSHRLGERLGGRARCGRRRSGRPGAGRGALAAPGASAPRRGRSGARRRGVSVACLHASSIELGVVGCRGSTVWLHAATAPNAPRRSTSWKAPGRRGPASSTCPVSASTGARSTCASHRPVSRFVAPGPGDRQARRRPAGQLARTPTRRTRRRPRGGCRCTRGGPASTWRRIASARPRLECPTMPNTWRTPQFDQRLGHHVGDGADVRRLGLDADVDAVLAQIDRVASAPSRRTRPASRRSTGSSHSRATDSAAAHPRSSLRPAARPDAGNDCRARRTRRRSESARGCGSRRRPSSPAPRAARRGPRRDTSAVRWWP